MRYAMVGADIPNRLVVEVNNLIASEYKPYGTPFLFNKVIMQAMTNDTEQAESDKVSITCSFCSHVTEYTQGAFKKNDRFPCPECGETNVIKKVK